MRIGRFLAVLFLLLAALLLWRNVLAADLALVLLTDVSGSMGDDEFKLVKEGYRAAFADPEVRHRRISSLSGS